MKERPILFNGEMVRAILEGRKTQTRRACKLTAAGHLKKPRSQKRWHPADPDAVQACPFGVPGDRLWVRETFRVNGTLKGPRLCYAADLATKFAKNCPDGANLVADDNNWRPSIHMPLWASRITLEVTAVRVERLKGISEKDGRDEGGPNILGYKDDEGRWHGFVTYREWYRDLWESINGPGSWDENPWVWVVEFKRVEESKC